MQRYITIIATILLALGWLPILFYRIWDLNNQDLNNTIVSISIITCVISMVLILSWELTPHRWKTLKELDKYEKELKKQKKEISSKFKDDDFFIRAVKSLAMKKLGLSLEDILKRKEELEKRKEDDKSNN